MSRKHLYHYFDQAETLAEAWRQTAASRGSAAAAAGQADTARVRDLEQRLDVWKMLAAVAQPRPSARLN